MKELNNKNQYFNIIVTHWKLEARDHTKHKIETFNNFYFETSLYHCEDILKVYTFVSQLLHP